MDQLQTHQQLQIIQADIELCERNRNKLLSELEQLQKTKTIAFKEYDIQIKTKQEGINYLTTEGKRLQGLCHLYSQSLEDLEKKIKEFKEEYIKLVQSAHIEVKSIHNEADNRIKAIEDREKSVENREKLVTERENLVKNAIKTVQERSIEVEKYQTRLEEREKKIIIDEEKSKQTLAQNQELLDDINRTILAKQKLSNNIDVSIENKQKEASAIMQEALNKQNEADKKLKLALKIEQANAIEKEELRKIRVKLEDDIGIFERNKKR